MSTLNISDSGGCGNNLYLNTSALTPASPLLRQMGLGIRVFLASSTHPLLISIQAFCIKASLGANNLFKLEQPPLLFKGS